MKLKILTPDKISDFFDDNGIEWDSLYEFLSDLCDEEHPMEMALDVDKKGVMTIKLQLEDL